MVTGRDLFISSFAPTLPNGRAVRTYVVVRALAELGPVDMAYVPFDGDEPSPQYAAIQGIEFHRITPSRGLRRAAAFARRRAAGYPPQVARGASPEIADAAERLASAWGRGRVIAGDMNVMAALMGLARRRPVIFNAHNIESSYRHDPRIGRVTWLPMSVTERRIFRRAAEAWVVSREDLELARRLVPSATLRYAPNVVDVDAIEPVPPRLAPGRTVLMVGDFTYEPNIQGLRLLLDEVLPHVRRERPDVDVLVAGRGSGGQSDNPHVRLLGFVDDLAQLYAAADVVAVPLLEGGGTSLKVLEAMAYRVPIVGTSLAARGLGLTPGEHYRQADDAERFAQQLLSVLGEGDAAMAARAREVVARDFSVAALTRLLAA